MYPKKLHFIRQFFVFIKKQASCALFGGLMLFFLVLSRYIEVPGINRYDLLFIIAVLIQIILILKKLERPREIIAILIFHSCAMLLEIFKTSVGSWTYPEPALLTIATVPLFSGFMYSAVGSYMARAWRINNFVFKNLPRKRILIPLAALIYINFFTNHFVADVRWAIFALLIIIFWKTKFYVTLTEKVYQIHPLITNALLALFVWFAEQIATFVRVWVYVNQVEGWVPVSIHKYTSWYILLIFSFIIVALLHQDYHKYIGKK